MTDVDRVSVTEVVDGLKALSLMALQFAGWGQAPDLIAAGSAIIAVQDRYYYQTVAFIGRRLFGLAAEDIAIDATYRALPAREPFDAGPGSEDSAWAGVEAPQTTYIRGLNGEREFFRDDWYWYLGEENRSFEDVKGWLHYSIEIARSTIQLATRFDASTEPADRVAPTTYLTAPLVVAIVPVCEAPPGIVYLDPPVYAATDLSTLTSPCGRFRRCQLRDSCAGVSIALGRHCRSQPSQKSTYTGDLMKRNPIPATGRNYSALGYRRCRLAGLSSSGKKVRLIGLPRVGADEIVDPGLTPGSRLTREEYTAHGRRAVVPNQARAKGSSYVLPHLRAPVWAGRYRRERSNYQSGT